MSDLYIYWGVYNSNFLWVTIMARITILIHAGVKIYTESLLRVI